MPRPRKVFPFESLQPGESMLFTEAEWGAAELASIHEGVRTRRRPDGRRRFSTKSRATTTQFLWVEVYCLKDSEV